MTEERVDPAQLRERARTFDTEIAPAIDRALAHLDGAPRAVAFPNFSTIGFALATAYVEAVNYNLADLNTKSGSAYDFRSRLETTATDWETTEETNTVGAEGS
jgi:hypothetical protein